MLLTEGYEEGDLSDGTAETIFSPLDSRSERFGLFGSGLIFQPGDILPGITAAAVSAVDGNLGELFVSGQGFSGASSIEVGNSGSSQDLVFSFAPFVDCAGGFFDPLFDVPTPVQVLDASGAVLGEATVSTQGFVGFRSPAVKIAKLVARSSESDFVDSDDIAFGDVPGDPLSVALAAQSPTTVEPGGSVSFEYEVINGTSGALSGGLFFYAGFGGRLVAQGTVATGRLASGGQVARTYSQTVPGAATVGEYDYFVCAGPSANAPTACSEAIFVRVTPAAEAVGDPATTWNVAAERWGAEADPVSAQVSSGSAGAYPAGAYPNPFTRNTEITFSLAEASDVALVVYDVQGRTVAELADGPMGSGEHRLRFDAAGLPSGLYVYRLVRGAQVETGRLTLVH